MDKIWIVTPEQLAEIKAVVKTVYNRDFKGKSISTDDIADIDSIREEFVSKCCVEMKLQTLSDKLVRTLINARKSSEL